MDEGVLPCLILAGQRDEAQLAACTFISLQSRWNAIVPRSLTLDLVPLIGYVSITQYGVLLSNRIHVTVGLQLDSIKKYV